MTSQRSNPARNPVQLLEKEGGILQMDRMHPSLRKERKVSIADSLDPGCLEGSKRVVVVGSVWQRD